MNDPELLKKIVSNVARGTNAVLGLAGAQVGTLTQLGHPERTRWAKPSAPRPRSASGTTSPS